jgi:Rieske Fe-S protein
MNRRTFLKTTAASGALVTIGTGAAGCGNNVEAAPLATVNVADAPAKSAPTLSNDATALTYGVIRVPWQSFPDLVPIGGAITLQIPNTIDATKAGFSVPPGGTVLLVHHDIDPQAGDRFLAVQSHCPHAGCPLGYSMDDKLIECPCHGSRFYSNPDDKDHCVGEVLHLPARAPLQTFATSNETVLFSDGTSLEFVNVDMKQAAVCGAQTPWPAIVNNTVTLPFADFPQLMMAGGSTVGQPMGLTRPLIAVRVSDGMAVALDARCTHLGCAVMFSPTNQDLECPCHGSIFGLDGHVIQDPATTPLRSYQAAIGASAIVITVV